MMRDCGECGRRYDDAMCNTICPHPELYGADTRAIVTRKDRALKMIGHDVVWRATPRGERLRIVSVGWDGGVSLAGRDGYFDADDLILAPALVH